MIRSPRGDEGGPDLRGFSGVEWEEASPEGNRRDHRLGAPAQALVPLSSTGKVTAHQASTVRVGQPGFTDRAERATAGGQGLGSHGLYTRSGRGQVATGVDDDSRGAWTTDTFHGL